MVYLERFLDAGGMAVFGVVVGAGLTYWFGAMNRRHQEQREDETRWYETRLKAYAAMPQVVAAGIALGIHRDVESRKKVLADLTGVVGVVRFVGSDEAVNAADRLFNLMMGEMQNIVSGEDKVDVQTIHAALTKFQAVARTDLGHPKAKQSAKKQ